MKLGVTASLLCLFNQQALCHWSLPFLQPSSAAGLRWERTQRHHHGRRNGINLEKNRKKKPHQQYHIRAVGGKKKMG